MTTGSISQGSRPSGHICSGSGLFCGPNIKILRKNYTVINNTVSFHRVYRSSKKGEKFMEMLSLTKELKENAYPGRGIVLGKSEDGKKQLLLILSWEEVKIAETVYL